MSNNKLSKYPAWVCFECGKRYGKGIPKDQISTYHTGLCGLCGEAKPVTEPRDFGHLKESWNKLVR